MKPTLALTLAAVLVAVPSFPAEKSDLTKEKYVEASATDFTLAVKRADDASRKVRAFEISAPTNGSFTVLCFVDGRFFRREKLVLPGRYSLSVRGLSSGKHQVTLQAVDKDGRVGSASHTITIEK